MAHVSPTGKGQLGDIDTTVEKYQDTLQPTYRLFAVRVQDLLASLLKSEGIQPHSITSREKSPASLREKIVREGKSYMDPLVDVTDLAGVRVITYFPADVDRIVPIIEREFSIDRENSTDKRRTTDPSVFGYASVHLVVDLSPARLQLPEYAPFRGLRCEIQVRTILQHSWAEIQHDIAYKSSHDIPFELRRRFASLAGLLEIADREFEALRQDETRIRNRIRLTVQKDNIQIPVDMESLSFYLQKYHQEKTLRSTAVSGLVRLLSENHIESVAAFHEMLSEEALAEADRELQRKPFSCKKTDRCLLRYALAVGNRLSIDRAIIGRYMRCPPLVEAHSDLVAADIAGSHRRRRAPSSLMPAADQPDAKPS